MEIKLIYRDTLMLYGNLHMVSKSGDFVIYLHDGTRLDFYKSGKLEFRDGKSVSPEDSTTYFITPWEFTKIHKEIDYLNHVN